MPGNVAARSVNHVHITPLVLARDLARHPDPFAISAIHTPSPKRTTCNTARSFPSRVTLDHFDMESASKKPYPSQRGYNTTCFLKACIVREPDNLYNIIFRIQALSFGECLPEMLFSDALIGKHDWIKDLMFLPRTMSWYHRNQPQLNDRLVCHRLFIIPCKGAIPTKKNLIKLGDWICLQLNRVAGNTTITVVDEFSYFWLNNKAVWADVLGYKAALSFLLAITGQPKLQLDFFEQHRDVIHSFFHQGTLTKDLAALLHAPYSEINPILREPQENEYCCKLCSDATSFDVVAHSSRHYQDVGDKHGENDDANNHADGYYNEKPVHEEYYCKTNDNKKEHNIYKKESIDEKHGCANDNVGYNNLTDDNEID